MNQVAEIAQQEVRLFGFDEITAASYSETQRTLTFIWQFDTDRLDEQI